MFARRCAFCTSSYYAQPRVPSPGASALTLPRVGWKSQYPEAHRRKQHPAPRGRPAEAGASWNRRPLAVPVTQSWGTGGVGYLKPGGSRGAQDSKTPQRDATWPPQTLLSGPSWTSAAAACCLIRSPSRPACQPPVAGFKGRGHPGMKEAGRAPKPKRFSTCPALDFSPGWSINAPARSRLPFQTHLPHPRFVIARNPLPPTPGFWLALLFGVILFGFVCGSCAVLLTNGFICSPG